MVMRVGVARGERVVFERVAVKGAVIRLGLLVGLGALGTVMASLSGCVQPNPEFLRDDGGVPGDLTPRGELVPHMAADDGAALACAGAACDDPRGACFQSPGSCDPDTGACVYAALPAGTPCVPDDMCQQPGTCDGDGVCVGAPISCALPHATGGGCKEGACHGYVCDAGWGDCNGLWTDGCEVDLLGDASHCGACDVACAGAANATVSCLQGQCALSCTAPFEDCNLDPADGCEIPVGQANACDRLGLSLFSTAAGATPGCGTPRCGPGTAGAKIESFGSWHCVFCSHCQLFADGGAWCLTDKGTFSADRCAGCCNPADPKYSQSCAAVP